MKELTIGSEISHYTIKGKLGEGGTGTVYHAMDSRLLRPVALKVLAPGQLDDQQSRLRFMQEARSASSLNHPNIVTIYDISEADGSDFIAMEYLTGKTLASQMGISPMHIGRAVHYAGQIADALAAAHQAGIVHRDIKPANVMITQRDDVKLLDFGLAKLDGPLPEEDADKTKVAGPKTIAGVMMGTLAYMSPEQAQGEVTGSPTDVFSFGVLLYEMLSGTKPFQGTSNLARLAAMLKTEATPLGQKVTGVPLGLELLVASCLQKDATHRPAMSDVLAQLRDIGVQTRASTFKASPLPDPSPTLTAKAKLNASPRLWIAVGALVLGAIASVAWFAPRSISPLTHTAREHILMRLTFDSGYTGVPSLSADGKLVAYASDRGEGGNLDIWMQQIQQGAQPVRITSDEADETEPCFSPDGSKIAFRSERENGGIYVVPSLGGQARLIAKGGRRPRYSPDGKWIAYWQGQIGFTYSPGSAEIKIVPADGGTPKTLQREFGAASYPVWLPDGSGLLFLGQNGNDFKSRDWWITPLNDGPVLRTGAFEAFKTKKMRPAPGYYIIAPETFFGDRVVFASKVADGVNLWDIGLPKPGRKVVGEPSRLTAGTNYELHPSTTATAMAFSSATVTTGIWRAPINHKRGIVEGDLQKLAGGPYFVAYPSLSTDGSKMIFVSERSGLRTLWLREMSSGKETQLTTGTAGETQPKISGDGTTIAYREGNGRLYVMTAGPDGKYGAPELLCERCGVPTSLSGDGNLILLESYENPPAPVLMDWRARKSSELFDFGQSKGLAYAASFSNDGKWVSFHITDGRPEVRQIFIFPFRSGFPKLDFKDCIPITNGNSLDREAVWSPDDNILYFLSERDGFRCIWAQKLDPATKHPRGEAYGVQHFHRVNRSLSSVPGTVAAIGLTVRPGQLVFSLGEITGNVWMQRDEAR